MRPLTMITGILLGSSVAITLSLTMVLFVFLVLGDEHARVAREFGPLTESVLIFLVLTVVSAASFYLLLINHRARFVAQACMWFGLVVIGWYYWP